MMIKYMEGLEGDGEISGVNGGDGEIYGGIEGRW